MVSIEGILGSINFLVLFWGKLFDPQATTKNNKPVSRCFILLYKGEF
ncbi:hypothetical protein BN938_1500 [Mucinivorans hirudinis]|uniref:Uncharacterized protein n=1 Tax=Mucinivorans hirudinis TaxID=1433126 RepID=A0A060R879_9BACT|nr:hypothetical protein BN938_1500 [Mucinivorans hirudinis]